MTDVPLPPVLVRLAELRPALNDRIVKMFRGCLRRGGVTAEDAAKWVIKTLREEAAKVVAAGVTPRPTRFKSRSQWARGMDTNEATDSAYTNALWTIGAIDRATLETPASAAM
jgi:hypothetical protein